MLGWAGVCRCVFRALVKEPLTLSIWEAGGWGGAFGGGGIVFWDSLPASPNKQEEQGPHLAQQKLSKGHPEPLGEALWQRAPTLSQSQI